MEHSPETTTPQDDGTLLIVCSCGASYIRPKPCPDFGEPASGETQPS